jgi:excisionase family DNA binding protein
MDREAKSLQSASSASTYAFMATLYRPVKKGELPGFRIGSDWRFNVEAIDRWGMRQVAPLSAIGEKAENIHCTTDLTYSSNISVGRVVFSSRRRAHGRY